MPVTSTTLAGVNVWQLSGNVTDTELRTAWAGIITNNRYLLNRAIYVDDTCSLVNVRGTYYIDSQNLGIILHSNRNKANTLFRNWFFTQTVGLSVGARSNFVRFTNGTTITNSNTDGIDMQGGGMMYAVVGNPGGGDPRFLNEMMFGSLDGTLVTSAAWTEQEIEPTSFGTIWRGLNIQKAAGYPILAATGGLQRHVIYRSSFNTEGATLRLIRPYFNNSICYVSSVIRRQGAPVTANLLDTFGSNGAAVIMVLNNFTDESWFGASKTNLTGANWNAGNRVIGGVMKKIQVQPSTLIRTYDSRSTTVSQKSTFSETTSDFLAGTDSTTSDAVTGRAQIVCVGAIATGASISITRFTGQRFTLQKFGFRVQVETPDMTFGDDDLSAFSPITMTAQNGLVRTQSAINAATAISSFQELLEELHVLAIGLQGAASYGAAYNGNHFDYTGISLLTNFTTVNIDPLSQQKISYNPATNALTIKATNLAGSAAVSQWRNPGGKINLLNGATISGVYEDSDGQRATVTGLDPEGFGITWHLRYRLQGTTPWTQISGTGNTALILLSEGAYDVQVRAKGYEWESALVLNTAVSLTLNAGLRFHVSANNTPQYTMPFIETLANIFQYDATALAVSVTNETGAIIQPGFAELYRATQRIQHIPELVWTWVAPVTANSTSQKILIPPGNPISMFLTTPSNASVKITCPVIYADTGESADDRVRGNPSGFSIILGSPATAESAGLQAGIVAALGGENYTEAQASQVVLRGLIDDLQTLVGQVKARTDLVPNEPATAQAVAAIGTPLQAADYVEPAPIADVAAAVRQELAPELANLDAAVSTRSTLTAQDIPEGLTADQVWSATTRTLTESAGLTAEQSQQLADTATKVQTLENTDVSNLATAASVQALGTPLQASAYTAAPTPAQNAAAVLAAQVEEGATVVQSLRIANAVLGGKVSGGQTGTEKFRNLADTKDVVVSTNDAQGNRTTVARNLT